MRAGLAIVVVGVGFLAVVLWLTLPPLAAGVIGAGLAAFGYSGQGTIVVVAADPPFELLTLHADTVTVRSSDVSWQGLSATRLSLTLTDVDLGARRAAEVDGRIDGVRLDTVDGPLTVSTIALQGPSDRIVATSTVSPDAVLPVARAAIERQVGTAPASVVFTPTDGISALVAGRTITGRLVVDAGVLSADLGPAGRIVVVAPGSGAPIALDGVEVTADGGLRLRGIVTAAALGLG